MPEVTQRAFAAGEVSPSMYGRADMVPYATGLRTARNVIGAKEGGMMNRPGTKFIRQMAVVGTKSHCFRFNDFQAYHLEFGVKDHTNGDDTVTEDQGYIRFTNQQSTLVLPAGTSTDVPAWADDTPYEARDLVEHDGRHYYCLADHTSILATNDPDLAGGVIYWYLLEADPGVAGGSIYEIPTPYDDIEDVWYTYPTQSADTMVVTLRKGATVDDEDGASYAPYLLRRFGHVFWDFVPAPYKPAQASPTNVAATVPSAGSYVYRYMVTALGENGESLPGPGTFSGPGPGTLATHTNGLIKVTSTAHNLANLKGPVYIKTLSSSSGVVDPIMQAFLLDQVFPIQVLDADNFLLNASSGITVVSGHTITYGIAQSTTDLASAPNIAQSTGIAPGEVGGPSKTAPNVVTWTAATGGTGYAIYREESDGSHAYGFIGTSNSGLFNDDGTPPDMAEAPPEFIGKFLRSPHHPAVCGFFNQRLFLGSSSSSPMQFHLSRAGDLFNFTQRSPIQADDAITQTLALKQVNDIRHITELGDGGLLLTTGTEGLLVGDGDEAITPATLTYRPQGWRGASRVFPKEIEDVILYCLSRGNQVVEIHRGEFGGYVQPIDPALFSGHLFGSACGCSPVAMDWAERPDRIVWIVRSDGMALGCTFMPNHNMRCWTRHDTRGLVQHLYKDVVVVPEGSLDTPYFTVSRTINGETVEYLEAMVPRCEGCDV